ncbi:MAG: MFS transporter, partial [Bacteroidales bacterium]|nr:MFS transporter [Bacteroidales bacterium]
MSSLSKRKSAWLPWLALFCLVAPMFASFYFDDMFSSVSYLFDNPSMTVLGWDAAGYGLYTSGYSVLCVFGGLVVCGILLDKWGIRVTGSIFVTMMVAGAGLVLHTLLTGGKVGVAYVGCMFFGLGSEIAGTTVTRSIAKWFKTGPMALAMGLQLSISRLGTALALVLSPRLIVQQAGHVYTLQETARPAIFGMILMFIGLILWAVFVAIDARHDSEMVEEKSDEAPFRIADVGKVFGNGNFWLLALLCVLFYSSVVAFKKFAGSILIPRFDIPASAAGWMVSMLPFSSVIFSPLFGVLVDKKGHGTFWMILGSILALSAHLLLAFAPAGVPFYGYLAMVFLGFGYSLVPAALWPSVPKVVPEKVL